MSPLRTLYRVPNLAEEDCASHIGCAIEEAARNRSPHREKVCLLGFGCRSQNLAWDDEAPRTRTRRHQRRDRLGLGDQ